jgi:GNS1/SUR4 family
MVNLSYFYALLKMTYFLESSLGELGKRPIQKSNYMLFHHIATAHLAWFIANFYPGGHTTLLMFVNCFVHMMVDLNYVFVYILFPQFKQATKWTKKVALWAVVRMNYFQTATDFIYYSFSSLRFFFFGFIACKCCFGILATFQLLSLLYPRSSESQ